MNIPRLAKLLGEADERYILEAAEEETKMTKKITKGKIIAVLAACVCLICLMAAGRALFDSKDYLEDFDADPSYMLQDKMITSDGEGNYFGMIMCRNGFRLMGSDGSGGENAYNICDVPGCDHTDNTVCLALGWPEFTGLSFYDGRLYWTARPKGVDLSERLDTVEILSAKADGSDIRVEREVSGEVFDDTMYNKYIRAHRGYMYFIGVHEPEEVFDPETMTSHKKDPDERYTLNVYAEELKENGGSEKIFSLEYEDGAYTTFTSQFYANDLYIMLKSQNMDDPEKIKFEIYKVDLNSHASKKIYSTEKYDISCWWMGSGERLYFTENGKSELMELDVGKGRPKKMFNIPNGDIKTVINGKAVSLDGNAEKVWVTDFDGRTTELDFSAMAEQVREEYGYAGIAVCGVDDKNVILQMCDDECFGIVPLDGSEPRLIIASCISDPRFERMG